MSMPASWREFLGFGFSCPSVIYRLQARLGKFKARLSSNRSGRETQKSLTRRCGLDSLEVLMDQFAHLQLLLRL